jgi:hypothetical protein
MATVVGSSTVRVTQPSSRAQRELPQVIVVRPQEMLMPTDDARLRTLVHRT